MSKCYTIKMTACVISPEFYLYDGGQYAIQQYKK